MEITLNVAAVIGSAFMMLLLVIASFLKGIMKRLESIETASIQGALQSAKMEAEVESIREQQTRIRDRNQETEKFFREFHNNVREVVSPFFTALNVEMKNIHNDIDRLNQGK